MIKGGTPIEWEGDDRSLVNQTALLATWLVQWKLASSWEMLNFFWNLPRKPIKKRGDSNPSLTTNHWLNPDADSLILT